MRRRVFLTLAASSCCLAENAPGRGEVFPSELKRYTDPTTEFPVVRLTAPTFNSYLTAAHNRGIGSRNFVLFSSDREGKLDVYRLDLRTGQQRRITEAEGLDPASPALLPDDRSFCYVDGPSLRLVNLGTLREHEVYRAERPYDRLGDIGLARGGASVLIVERQPGRDRLRLVPLSHGPATDVVESADEISMPLAKPGGGVVYRSKGMLHFRSQREEVHPLRTAPGRIGPVYWSPDGSSLLYLSIPQAAGERNSIREYVMSTGQDRLIARTTQFIDFASNRDASVFVGASESKAAPDIFILIRSVRRELTMCEHRARHLHNLAVAFTPNSQSVLFQSDQHGKSALYMVAVERFVAETES